MKSANGNGLYSNVDELSPDQGGQVWEAPGGPLMLNHDLPHIWKHLHALYGLKATTPPDADSAATHDTRRQAITRWLNSFDSRDEVKRALEAADLAWGEVHTAKTLPKSLHEHRPAFVNGLPSEVTHDDLDLPQETRG